MVKNLASSAGDTGLLPGRGTKIPHALEQLAHLQATTELVHFRAQAPQQENPEQRNEDPAQPKFKKIIITKKKKRPGPKYILTV